MERLFTGGPATAIAASSTTREDYIDRVTAGGFPIPLARASPAGRARWFDDNLRLTLERDVRSVVGELLKQASWMDGVAGLGHWRTRDGDEVDLVIERDDGAVVAFAVKASQRVGGAELAPLRKLRDAVGQAFVAGVALHLGSLLHGRGPVARPARRPTLVHLMVLSRRRSRPRPGPASLPRPSLWFAPMGARTSTATNTRSVHRMKVTLLGTDPPIWRRLPAPSSTTLGQLHHVLQEVMGWEDCHLHEFAIGASRYGPRGQTLDSGWERPPKNEAAARLYSVAPLGTRFMYEYDFGDGWRHEVVVEQVDKVPADEPGADGPVCLSGQRACPPEDCGGVWGYEHLLEVVADPAHEEHADMLEWVGDSHDPEQFDPVDVNRQLGRGAVAASTPSRR